MTLHGAPMLAQSPLTRLRSTTNDAELNAMRAAAWHRHGVASIAVDDITDPWLRQAITNEANRRWRRQEQEGRQRRRRHHCRGQLSHVTIQMYRGSAQFDACARAGW